MTNPDVELAKTVIPKQSNETEHLSKLIDDATVALKHCIDALVDLKHYVKRTEAYRQSIGNAHSRFSNGQ